MNVVDSSAWLEYFADGPNAEVFAPAIEATTKLIVPVVTVYEVYKKIKLEVGEDKAIEAVAVMSRGKIVEVDVSVALEAADLSLTEQLTWLPGAPGRVGWLISPPSGNSTSVHPPRS